VKLLTAGVQYNQSNGIAFMKAGNGPYVVGLGPFEEFSTAPESGTAFYCNDFTLSNPCPWRVPAEVVRVDRLAELGLVPSLLKQEWQDLEPEKFAGVFGEINEMINRGVIEKSVPVATEQCVLSSVASGEEVSGGVMMGNMRQLEAPFYSYGWSKGDSGFCGGSPELLFELNGRQLKTMALAGTAKADELDVFSVDGKEIREHEFVAQTLVAKLSDIGHVVRGDRTIMDLGQLVHFHTSIEVELFLTQGTDGLIRRLHPTPALGPLPRTEETLRMLADWRQRLYCPSYFGAPFGLLDNGEFRSIVAIRSVHWEGSQLSVPSGCGVIEASRLVNEWRELRLKREAVKAVFGL